MLKCSDMWAQAMLKCSDKRVQDLLKCKGMWLQLWYVVVCGFGLC